MRQLFLLFALAAGACERDEADRSSQSASARPGTIPAVDAPASKPPDVVPKPEDQAQLDRMILAGFTPHADHLHAPGVNECPLTKGTEAVM